jgi:hypothetical protein
MIKILKRDSEKYLKGTNSISFLNNYKGITIIASLTKSILEVKNKKNKEVNKETQYIASTVLIFNDLNIEKLLNYLIKSGYANTQIEIIQISYNE